jgi:hypothetical protein
MENRSRSQFGIVRGEEPFRVRLLFSATVAAYIGERVWHPTQRIEEQPDGGIILELETAGWKELVRWILSWQPDVQVLEPARLRDRIREKLAQGLEMMEENDVSGISGDISIDEHAVHGPAGTGESGGYRTP